MLFDSIKGKEGISIFMLCICITFVFVTVSTPIAQFKGKGLINGGASRISCITYWGHKDDCTLNPYSTTIGDSTCKRTSDLFKTSEAFSIISVFVTLAACICCGLQFVNKVPMPVTGTLAVLSIITCLIPWACMTGVWYNNYCTPDGSGVIPSGKTLRTLYKFSAGYGLYVAAWCLDIVGTICLFVL